MYGRLIARTETYKITSSPEDLTIFKEVLDNLNDGKSSGHTPVSEHRNLELKIEDNEGVESVLSFPDYGGEQIRIIVNDRRIDRTWQEQIEKSNSWLLFIRVDEIRAVEDVVNRGLPDPEVLKNRTEKNENMVLSDNAFYTELLQMFLYVKNTGIRQKINKPKLTIVLSCWDLLTGVDLKKTPSTLVQEKLPGLFSFIAATWEEQSMKVMGLSSIGKNLSHSNSDHDYVNKGPENFGFIITDKGKKESDLTLIISTFID